MKTNQMMEVSIGDYGSIMIGHKARFGSAKDVMSIGNKLRENRGLKKIPIEEIIRRRDFWEFAIARNCKLISEISKLGTSGEFPEVKSKWFIPNFKNLNDYKDTKGRLKYVELIKEMPLVIKSSVGKGTWMELSLLLKLATYLDKVLEEEIYDTFINHKILECRDESGNSFKKLCSALNQKDLISDYEDYKVVSRALKVTILGERYEGISDVWNKIATKEQLAKRDKMELYLINIINDGLVKSFDDCLKVIKTKRK